MKHTRGRVVHIESVDDLDQRLDAGARRLRGWRFHQLDLRERVAALLQCRLDGATFLACTFDAGQDDALTAAGALVMPSIPNLPLDVYRPHLYTAAELYDATDYAATLDARAYAWAQQEPSRDDALAAALHDHSISSALTTWAQGRHLAGVMGGHAVQRGDDDFRAAAHLGSLLAEHAVVATGGGPGAMEAANLGATLRNPDAVTAAVDAVAQVPSFRPSVQAWVDVARTCLDGVQRTDTLGVPTWFYGHEPPNVFATAIAKFVGNAQREAILLELCNAGIVFLPGAGGTVQEIFQDACENYYADVTAVAPMVLVGRAYWTEQVPAWPLLKKLAGERPMAPHIHLVDGVEEAAAIIAQR